MKGKPYEPELFLSWYFLNLFSFLDEADYFIHVINPIQTDGWRKGTEIRKRKTDIIDSILIADLIRYGSFKDTALANEAIFSLRQLTRYRSYLVGTAGDFKRKIIAVLDQVFPEYDTVFSKVGLFWKDSKAVLLEYSTPDAFNEITANTLAETLRLASRNRIGLVKAETLKTAASKSFGIRFAQDAFTFQLRSMIEQLNFLEEQIKQTEEEINQLMASITSVIETITGIGPITGATILGEIGDIHNLIAIVAVSRKLCYIIHAVLTKNESYEIRQ